MDNQQVSGNENTKKQAGRVQANPTRHNRVGLSGNQEKNEAAGFEGRDDDSGIGGAEGTVPYEFENEAADAGGDAPLSQGSSNRGSSGGAGGAQFGQGANTNRGGVEKKSEGNLLGQGGYGTSGTSGTSSGGNQGYGSGIGQAGSQNGSTGYNAGSQGMPQKLNEKKEKGSRSDNAGSNKGTTDNSLRDLQ